MWPFSVGACVDGVALGTVEENPLFAKKLLNGAATGEEEMADGRKQCRCMLLWRAVDRDRWRNAEIMVVVYVVALIDLIFF